MRFGFFGLSRVAKLSLVEYCLDFAKHPPVTHSISSIHSVHCNPQVTLLSTGIYLHGTATVIHPYRLTAFKICMVLQVCNSFTFQVLSGELLLMPQKELFQTLNDELAFNCRHFNKRSSKCPKVLVLHVRTVDRAHSEQTHC